MKTDKTEPEEKKIVISFKNVSIAYGNKKILDNVSFDIYEKEIVTIAGPSGTGKSTILKLIIGLIQPDKGEISVNTDKIGMAFQYPALFNSMTIYENVALALRETTKLKKDEINKRVEESLEIVGLEHTETLFPEELSGGMQKRASIARAIALLPNVILYDEPSSGLDPQTASKFEEDMVRFRDEMGVTSIVVSHDMGTIQNVSDKIFILDKAKFAWQGTLESFLSDNSEYPMIFKERFRLKKNNKDK
jgi:phospholipid/cholesterol/gamma-HCH transport system ATP-binding protein